MQFIIFVATGFVTFRSIKSLVGATQWEVLDDNYPDLQGRKHVALQLSSIAISISTAVV